MGVFSRLTDIINSNLTAMLDRAEDPEKMIRLIIQEMEDTLVEVRSSAARTIAEKKGINRQLDRLADTVGEWERKAEFAISRGREDLAKGALLEKSKVADAAKALEDELSLLDESLAKNDQDVARLESKLTEAKAKQKTIRSRKETVDSRLKVRRQLHDPRVDDAFARFEKIEKRIDATEGEIESYDLGKRKSLSDEIAELEAESSIEKELEALKARVGNTPKS
ncbi:MAG: phage shock protein PspA [Alphaproteobacteria bacterium]